MERIREGLELEIVPLVEELVEHLKPVAEKEKVRVQLEDSND